MKRMIGLAAVVLLGGCVTSSPTTFMAEAERVSFTSPRDAATMARCLERRLAEDGPTEMRDGVAPGSYEVVRRYDVYVLAMAIVEALPPGSRGTGYYRGPRPESWFREGVPACGGSLQ